MENIYINNLLTARGLQMSPLNALHPDESLYSILLIQPLDSVAACNESVKCPELLPYTQKYSEFLKLAVEEGADLVLAPEYSCPWPIVEESILLERFPAEGALWVLGCESITPIQLAELTARHGNIIWLHEDVRQRPGSHFLDPVCYFFRATDASGESHVVAAVQFKGQPMSDHSTYLERDNLITGRRRYILRNGEESIYLTALICSDSLNFLVDDLPQHLHHPYIIPHVQLNTNPRHIAFRHYRQDAYLKNRRGLEFICVNWAKGFSVAGLDPSDFGGSAYYTKSNQLILTDERLEANHQKGLYYTKFGVHHAHIYFLNCSEHVFLLRTTKPSQAAADAVLQRRTGPEMLKLFTWSGHTTRWEEVEQADDGFLDLCDEVGEDLDPVSTNGMTAINKERLLALSNGKVGSQGNWFRADHIDFFDVKEDEVIHRITVGQEIEPSARVQKIRYLANFSRLKNEILANANNFPECIKDLTGNFIVRYPIVEGDYNHNLCRPDLSGSATAVYLGACSPQQLSRVYDDIASILSDEDRRRLVIWHQRAGGIFYKCRDVPPQIDDELSENPRSFTRGE